MWSYTFLAHPPQVLMLTMAVEQLNVFAIDFLLGVLYKFYRFLCENPRRDSAVYEA